ncbi:MAG: calcium/sodium antiporter [Bacilli bacterium]|nr:calcium/sodium antiporter [Bacilli bacterium]
MNIIIFIISLCLMIYGANLLVNGSVLIANRFKIPEFIIGALIVGIGTSLPELVVSLTATINGMNDVAVGNVIGSNIFNILGILGLTALLYPININKESTKFDIPIFGIITILIYGLSFSRNNVFGISRFDGIILLSFFAFYVLNSLKLNEKQINKEAIIENISLTKSIISIIGGLILLIINCDLFIDSSVNIARYLNVSESFISLTIISCGTSMPELVSSVTAAFKKKSDIAIGNIVGSNIFNIAFILGTCSLVEPLTNSNITQIDYLVMIFATLLVIICGLFGKINRKMGAFMILSFIAYVIYLYLI